MVDRGETPTTEATRDGAQAPVARSVAEGARAVPASRDAAPGAAKRAKSRRAGPRPKHVPQRMCVACRERDAKRTLTRIVRTPEGQVEIDPTGRRNGRGAYLCDSPGCWEKAIRGGLLTRALNVTLTAEAIDSLRQRAAALRAAQPAEPTATAGAGVPLPGQTPPATGKGSIQW